ncbi:conserved hypothetical protein [Uncinocarpus reesii 1704]|uniref:Uncharacterized protein n=1 Tax=Uncinocarpus reesii (strain UAMH 1704) TaxID=336963 RepID=C4JTD0_UNCRE|nr:uncharacterized protein UREG_05719 [Uncinocarpus reesii 1704]EEP80877.1 conserved hypothetical protein [Uncinocarpus reesii 1704]
MKFLVASIIGTLVAFSHSSPVDNGGTRDVRCAVDSDSGLCRSVEEFYHGDASTWSGSDMHRRRVDTGPPRPAPDRELPEEKGPNNPPEKPKGPPSDNGDVGKRILQKALTAKGKPYAWGGGSCKGPTGDIAPKNHGEVGFDCSGLVCWAVCQVTGRDLFAENLRVTSSMYCASEKKLKYKDSGDRMWNAPNDRVNKVQENRITKFGAKPCPYVIRFTL